MKKIAEEEKMSLVQCRKMLKNGHLYSNAEIFLIREWIYRVAEITLEYLQSRTPIELIKLRDTLLNNNSENKSKEEMP